MLRAKEWERVVAALQRLGCETYHETQEHVFVGRFPKWQPVPKRPLSAQLQRVILGALEIAESDYERALAQTAKISDDE